MRAVFKFGCQKLLDRARNQKDVSGKRETDRGKCSCVGMRPCHFLLSSPVPISSRHLAEEMATYLTRNSLAREHCLLALLPRSQGLPPCQLPGCKYCRRRWRPANSFSACERWEMRPLPFVAANGHNFSLVDLNRPRSCPRAGSAAVCPPMIRA